MIPISNIIYLYKNDGILKIESSDPEILEKITSSLGITPNIQLSNVISEIKLIICMEGPTDIEFIKNVSNFCFNLNLTNHPNILIIPLGGGNLEHWVNFKYLDKLPNIPQLHIYDRDVKKYLRFIGQINQSSTHKAYQTSFYEIENYIHPDLHQHCYKCSIPFIDLNCEQWKITWKDLDIPKQLSTHLKHCYNQGDIKLKEYSPEHIKKKLCYEASQKLTKELLIDMGAYDEINEWMNHIHQKILQT